MSETKLATKADLKEMYDRMLPYMGGMPEMLANKFSKGDLYSTDEKMIGQWIDGKPIYQKTINFGALPNVDGKSVVIDSNLSIDKVVSMSGQAFSSVNGESMPISFAHPLNLTYAIMCRVQDLQTTSPCVYVYTKYDYSTYNAYITVTYTKNTDSPVAIGSDTDYSTDEKIVGTWIDGKPLYQRTFVTTNSYFANSSNDFIMTLDEISIANLDSLVSCHVLLQNKIANTPPFRYVYNTSASKLKLNFTYVETTSISSGFTITEGTCITIQYTKTT